jgi:hypothetical protein
MGTKFSEIVYDEHGIGGGEEYFGDNDAQLDCISVFTTRPRWKVRAPRGALRPRARRDRRRARVASQRAFLPEKFLGTNYDKSPCEVTCLSDLHTGARHSVRAYGARAFSL